MAYDNSGQHAKLCKKFSCPGILYIKIICTTESPINGDLDDENQPPDAFNIARQLLSYKYKQLDVRTFLKLQHRNNNGHRIYKKLNSLLNLSSCAKSKFLCPTKKT